MHFTRLSNVTYVFVIPFCNVGLHERDTHTNAMSMPYQAANVCYEISMHISTDHWLKKNSQHSINLINMYLHTIKMKKLLKWLDNDLMSNQLLVRKGIINTKINLCYKRKQSKKQSAYTNILTDTICIATFSSHLLKYPGPGIEASATVQVTSACAGVSVCCG